VLIVAAWLTELAYRVPGSENHGIVLLLPVAAVPFGASNAGIRHFWWARLGFSRHQNSFDERMMAAVQTPITGPGFGARLRNRTKTDDA
jgi:hypothetical protein